VSLIEWKDEFSIGIAAVDHEHQQLIVLINELHDAMSGENATITVLDFLGEIHAHIAAHFALEEKIMRALRYDQYEEHKQDHERLLDEISDIMEAWEKHDFYNDDEFSQTIGSWFTDHFSSMDARLHKHMH